MDDDSAERRQHVRKALRSVAHLLFPGHPPLAIRTLDLSLGGLGIIAGANPPPKLRCRIRFSIPLAAARGSTAVETEVEVAHSVLSSSHADFIVGLQFTSLAPEARRAVAKFLEG